MRFLLVILLTSWLAGTTLGATNQSAFLKISTTAVLIWTATWYTRLKIQVMVACLVLLGIGCVYGLSSQPKVVNNCTMAATWQGTITKRAIGIETVTYTVSPTTQPSCLVLLKAPRYPLFTLGDVVKSSGGQRQLVRHLKPELAGYQKYLQRQGIVATVSFSKVDLLESHPTWQTQQYDRVRNLIQSTFREPTTSLVSAMLINDVGSLPEEITTNLQLTGTNHIISISGLHLSLLAGMLLVIVTAVPITRTQRTVLLIVILMGYVIFIGAPVAAVRALIFWTVALVALRLGWLSSLVTMLFITLTILISYNPQLWLDISFQLSCLAVTGIFFLHFLAKPLIKQLPRRRQPAAALFKLLPALLVSLGATLTTWPVVAYYFGTVSFISLLANLLIVPLSTLVLVSTITALTLSVFSPILGTAVASITHLSSLAIFKTTAILANLPGSSLSNVTLSLKVVAIYYLALILLSLWWLKHQKRSWREVWI